MQSPTMLTVGDTVRWRGGFGLDPEKLATITGITLCTGTTKYGPNVREIGWPAVSSGRSIIVDLDNGHWAYGSQLDPA